MAATRRVIAGLAAVSSLAALLVAGTASAAAAADPVGYNWSSRKVPVNNTWSSVAYGNGVFVAVATGTGTGNRVMTSPDGINWTVRSAPDANWIRVVFGKGTGVAGGRFVAVSGGSAANKIMTSTDGITWTANSAGSDRLWYGAVYANNLFVVTGSGTKSDGTGTGARVMTSPDGLTWTDRVQAADNGWTSVTYGKATDMTDALFVAASSIGTAGQRVMTSPDGITWTLRSTPADNSWQSVSFGNNMFVAVAVAGAGNRVMTSPDGISWTLRASVNDTSQWRWVTYGNGMFVAVAGSGTSRGMTSPDGIAWTARSIPTGAWVGVTYAESKFVAVSQFIVATSNDAFVNQVKSSVDNATVTDTIQLVPASGTTPSEYVIYNNTQARLAKSPNGQGGTPSTRWAIWGYKWADKTLTAANSNTIPISLATYQNAGSCTALGMPAKDCPRPLGALAPGQSMPFRASYKVGSTWENTPIVTITRPPAD